MSYDELETELRANPMLNVDAAAHILHENTIAFLRSETMQQFKTAYARTHGEPLSLLPSDRVVDADVSYANYGYLAVSGGALQTIYAHTDDMRMKYPVAPIEGMARDFVVHPIGSKTQG